MHAHRKLIFPLLNGKQRLVQLESLDDDRRIERVAVQAFEAQECFFQGRSEKESETGAALE